MKTALYLVSDTFTLLAYLAVANVVYRERIPVWPGIYATWCAIACGMVWLFSGMPEFREDFMRYGVAALLIGWASFATVELCRLLAGQVTREEAIASAALLLGVALSTAGGLTLRGHGRMVFQAAAVVVPVIIALAAIGARPLPEPIEIATPAAMGAPAPQLAGAHR